MAKKPAKEAVELAAPEKKKRTTKPPERPVTEPARKKRGRPTKAEKAAEEERIRQAQKRRQLTTAEWRKIRTIGEIRTFAQDPVLRVLESVRRRVRDRATPDGSLMRDWEIFN